MNANKNTKTTEKVKTAKARTGPAGMIAETKAEDQTVSDSITEQKATKKVPAKKAEKTPATPVLRVLAKGVIYFPKAATETLAGLPYVRIEVKGNKVILTPTKSAKDAQEIRHNQIGASKILAGTGWDKTTQDLPIKMVGDSIQVEVR